MEDTTPAPLGADELWGSVALRRPRGRGSIETLSGGSYRAVYAATVKGGCLRESKTFEAEADTLACLLLRPPPPWTGPRPT